MGRLRMYAHPDGRTAVHESGFSWLAAWLLPVWSVQRRLHAVATAAFIVNALPSLLGVVDWLAWQWCGALSLALALTYGFLSAPLHAWWLRRGGWVLVAEEPLPGKRQAR